ncbi:MAG: hypothetical protein WAZ18_00505 [Alphaproteobacteria bacterium]
MPIEHNRYVTEALFIMSSLAHQLQYHRESSHGFQIQVYYGEMPKRQIILQKRQQATTALNSIFNLLKGEVFPKNLVMHFKPFDPEKDRYLFLTFSHEK